MIKKPELYKGMGLVATEQLASFDGLGIDDGAYQFGGKWHEKKLNLISNPFFNTDANGWTLGEGWSWDASKSALYMQAQGSGSLSQAIDISKALVASSKYFVVFMAYRSATAAISISVDLGGTSGTSRALGTTNPTYYTEIITLGENPDPNGPEKPDIDQLCNKIKMRICNITIPRRGPTELYYQGQLHQWLLSEFKNTEWEKSEQGRRPDLVVNNIIAVEVKGPTTNASLKDLITKTVYLKKYKRLFCVLFEHDYDESEYQEITRFLRNKFGKRIEFIQKSSGWG